MGHRSPPDHLWPPCRLECLGASCGVLPVHRHELLMGCGSKLLATDLIAKVALVTAQRSAYDSRRILSPMREMSCAAY